MKRLLIIGAGGHGRAIAEIALANGSYEVRGFLDDGATGTALGLPVLGDIASLERHRDLADHVIVGIGNNGTREREHARVRTTGFLLATVIHPRAVVAPSARIGAGCAVMACAVIGTEAELGEGVIINSGGVVDHHCRIEPFGHLGTNSSMAGGAVLGRGSWLQAGAAIAYRVVVPSGEVVRAGEGRTAD